MKAFPRGKIGTIGYASQKAENHLPVSMKQQWCIVMMQELDAKKEKQSKKTFLLI